MKEQNLNIRYMVAQLSELSQQEQELVNRAKAATSNAYANYSHFYVGAALLLGDGRIVIGANRRTPPSRRDSVPSAAPSSVPRATIPTSLS